MPKRKLSRREFLCGASVLVAGSILSACAPPSTPAPAEEPPEEEAPTEAPAAEEGVLVQYWAGWGAAYASVWDLLRETEDFAKAIGNNELEVKGSVSAEALLTAVAAGTPPHGAACIQYTDFMARGVLESIEELVAVSTMVKQDNYVKGNWDFGFYMGVQYGVPAQECFACYGLDYNARMVEEAGLDPDSPPVTWGDCLAWHKELTKFDDAGSLLQIGLDPYDGMSGWAGADSGFFIPLSWGWQWFDEESREFDLGNENMADALETYAEFVKIAGPDNLAGMRQVEGHGTWGGSFNAEVQAMIIEGYWHPGETANEKPEVAPFNRATWAPVPENRRGVKIQGSSLHYIVFFKEAENIEPMFEVAEFLQTEAACDIIFENLGWLPALIPYLRTVDQGTYPGLDFYFKALDEVDEYLAPSTCEIYDFVNTQFNQLGEAVYRDEMTGTEAAAEFQKRCDEEYEAAGFA